MILEKETFENIGKTFDEAKSKDKITCKCDYCGIIYERNKKIITASKKNNFKDACLNIECIMEKRKETNLERYGSESPFGNKEVQKKKKATFLERYGSESPFGNKEVQKKKKATFLERYGSESPFGNKEVQKNKKATNLERYGCENPFGNKEVQKKIREINIERYGSENPSQNKEVQEKKKQTNLERYGSEFPMQNKEICRKVKQTNLERYGSENPLGNKEVQEKMKVTNLERYGSENPSQNKEVQEKKKQTNLERYGSESPLGNKEVQEKMKVTNLERYGFKCSLGNKEVQEKMKVTNLERYGSENPSQNKEVQEKKKQTNLERYGSENPSQNKEVQEKRKVTNLEHYGSESPFGNKEVQEKKKQTNLERYGSENPMQNEEVKKKKKQTSLERYGSESPFGNKEVQEKIKVTNLDRYGSENPFGNQEVQEKIRQTCIELYGKFPVNNYGKTQNEIKLWLNSFGFNFQSTYQLLNGKEIDLYDENKKIAIEYCGLYWHNELSPQPRNKDYHYEKYKICLEKGIQLITIFEDEWINREFQCKSHLKSVLGVIDKKIFARKCIIKEISILEAQEFFNNYHIQGCNRLHIITFGLFYEEELVGAISLGRHNRQNIDNSIITLDRLCFKDGIQVVGGASRLFSQCVKWSKDKYKQILSFSDNRWSLGNVYKILNFVLDKEYKPDYSYVNIKNSVKRLSKQSQSKKSSNCPVDKTEYEWALERGLGRIWDCGKKRWIFNL